MSAQPRVYTLRRSWSYALWLLSRKSYTSAEMHAKLTLKQAHPNVIDAVIRKLESYHYLDDQRYVDSYLHSRQHKKGRLRLRQELRRKGVAEQLVEQGLEALDTETELQAAKSLLSKNQWRFQTGDLNKNYARAYGFLARRGFTVEVVQKALAEWSASADDA